MSVCMCVCGGASQRRNGGRVTVVLARTTTTAGRTSATVARVPTTSCRECSRSSCSTPTYVTSSSPPSTHAPSTVLGVRPVVSADTRQRATSGRARHASDYTKSSGVAASPVSVISSFLLTFLHFSLPCRPFLPLLKLQQVATETVARAGLAAEHG